jgi:hypothetical protein
MTATEKAWTDNGLWHRANGCHPPICQGCTSDESRWGKPHSKGKGEVERDTRLIKGEPYTITRIAGLGYGVTAVGSPVDRIGRAYMVQLSGVGVPIRCSCNDHHHRGGKCKHMTEVEAVVRETALAGLEEIGKGCAMRAEKNYWSLEDHPKAQRYADALPALRIAYRRIKGGATPRPVLRGLLRVAHTVGETNALNRLIERV